MGCNTPLAQRRGTTYSLLVTATHLRRTNSSILTSFSWSWDGIVLNPQDFGEISLRLRNNVSLLPSSYAAPLIQIRQHFLNSWKVFETNLLALRGDSRFQDVLKVLGIGVHPETSPTSLSLASSHLPPLSVFDYQRLCNVLAGYKYAELLVLRGNIGCRALKSAQVSDLCFPPSSNSRNTPHVHSLLYHHFPV